MRVLGVDGCRGGWLCCVMDDDRSFSFSISPDLASVVDTHREAGVILVDVPIGLPERNFRECDLNAKSLLGKFNSRVFLTPPRGVLEVDDYHPANARCRELTDGKGLMKQLWAIAPKIREADGLIAENETARRVLRECHPEICFMGLAGAIIPENKTNDEGYAARVDTLSRFVKGVPKAVEKLIAIWPRRILLRDDVLDAMVAALTARLIVEDPARERTLPDTVPSDAMGIPMEMVFAQA